LREWLSDAGAGVQAATFREAAEHGELLVLAVLGDAAHDVIDQAGAENFSGKVVIDAMNPLDFSGGFPPKLSISGEDSLGERVQRALPDANVVKAFNTIGNPYFVDPEFSQGKPTMLIAGDDEAAKRLVGDVLADFGWPDRVDIGGIEGSRELEAMCIAWVKIGGARGSWDHGFKLLIG
jgi:8-hydroxy-5-deazaflavin:NADPH oxidoreductase